jgi:predicted nucleic acid-binding protein
VILVDANLVIYAHVDAFSRHQAARDWLGRRLNGVARVNPLSA